MPSVTFRIRGKSIIMDFKHGRKIRKPLSTKIILSNEKHWNKKTQKVRIIGNEPRAVDYNNRLRNLKNHMFEEFDKLTLSKKPVDNISVLEIFKKFDEIPANIDTKMRLNFNVLFEEYISSALKHRINRKSGLPYAKNSIQSWQATFSLIKFYQKKKGTINLEDINDDLYDKIVYFLRHLRQIEMIQFRNEKRKPKEEFYNESYIGRSISNLKSFFNYIIKSKEINLPFYYSDNWKVVRKESDNIYLTNEELMKMHSLDLSHKSKYEKVRDSFLVSAFTGGMRISEYNKLLDENYIELDGQPCIEFYSKKVKREHIVPIPPIALEIMKKYNNKIPEIQPQDSNEMLKKIGKMCGFKDLVTVKEERNGKRITKQIPKYNLIMNHTARRSFCTNAYKGGVDTLTIMTMSNHKSEKTFLGYIKVTKEEYALRFSKTEYFRSLSSIKLKF